MSNGKGASTSVGFRSGVMSLPESSSTWNDIEEKLVGMRLNDADWMRGRTSLHVYHAGPDVQQVALDAFAMFMNGNALAPAAFPSLQIMEAEVVGMSLGLLGGGPVSAGCMTSGGTESIILAVLAAKSWFSQSRRSTNRAAIIVPESAHPAYYKAGKLLDVDVIAIPIEPNFRVCVEKVRHAMSDATMMIVGSAPSLPFGVIDPIEELGQLARDRDVWLHVDACLGGYFAPFAAQAGYAVPRFDLGVVGVRSISADLHKYGYTLKGASTILYANSNDLERQYFEFSDWPKGHYFTSTLAGTRSGGVVAACWSVMQYLGNAGYLRLTKETMEARKKLFRGLGESLDFKVLGDPDLGIFAYTSASLDMFAVADRMEARGWHVSRVAIPRAIHMTLTATHVEFIDEYLCDLNSSANEVRSGSFLSQARRVETY